MKIKNAFLAAACMLIAAAVFSGCPQPDQAEETYTVTFAANAGTDTVTNVPSAVTNVASGAVVAKPDTDPVRSGYTFSGWYKESACTTAWTFASDTVTADVTLYAGWTAEAVTAKYTVTFDANAGTDTVTGMPSAQSGLETGTAVSKPDSDPVREGYTFCGWYTEAGCTTEWNFTLSTMGTSDRTLYAKWIKTQNLCTITFDTGTSGWTCPAYNGEKDSVVDLNTHFTEYATEYALTRPDYVVSGVYLDSGYTQLISMYNHSVSGSADYTKYTLSESKTFYVKMTRQYWVTVDANGGTFTASGTSSMTAAYSSGTIQTVINNCRSAVSREGYVFSKLTSDKAGTTAPAVTDSITENITLYVQWAKIDTGLNGWWLYTENSTDYVMYLNTVSGKGFCFTKGTGSNYQSVTLTDSQITCGGTSYSYTYANNVLSFNSVTCAHPSEALQANGSEAATYIWNNGSIEVKLAADSTFTICSTTSTALQGSGKWHTDGSTISLLDSSGNLVCAMSSGAVKVDYSVYGGKYYNFEGSEKASHKDSYSLYLDTDGTYTMYLLSKELKGMWYYTTASSITTFYMIADGGTCYAQAFTYNSTSFETVNRVTVSGSAQAMTLTQSSAKGTVVAYAQDSALCGDWQYAVTGISFALQFSADGILTSTMAMSGVTQKSTGYYTTDTGKIYIIDASPAAMLMGASAIWEYTISGSSLTLTANGQPQVLTKK